MTYEEMQRMMEFILEQQAQLTAKQQRADERIDRANRLITRTARTVDRLATYSVERFERTDARISGESEDVNAKLAALADAQIRTEEVVKQLGQEVRQLGEKVERTSESIKQTDEIVRNLTEAVNHHIRDHGNGERDVSRE